MNKKDKQEAIEILEHTYTHAKPELEFKSDFELLIAVMLSAQCTDKRVNKVTAVLFDKYNTAEQMAQLTQEGLETIIRSCGLSKSKAANIINTSRILCEKYNGNVPQDLDLLQQLPGVGRKTANVVASVAFGIAALAVDTHVFRVGGRLGLSSHKDVLSTEKELCAIIPKEKWAKAHHWLIFHGRYMCTAKNPNCKECPLDKICDYCKIELKTSNKNLLKAKTKVDT